MHFVYAFIDSCRQQFPFVNVKFVLLIKLLFVYCLQQQQLRSDILIIRLSRIYN